MKKIQFLLILFVGLLVGVTTEEASAASYEYDELGRIISVQYENGSSIEYTYDASGNITTIIKDGETTEIRHPEIPPLDEDNVKEEDPAKVDEKEKDEITPPVTDDDNDNKTKDKDTDNDSDTEKDNKSEKEESIDGETIEEIAAEDDGDQLANTATTLYTTLLIGALLLASGAIVMWLRRKHAN